MKQLATCIVLVLSVLLTAAQVKKMQTEVLVAGGGTGGTAAGIQAARTGAKTLIVEQTNWLGGMLTAAGVSCTDGNHALPSGMWEEFRQALYTHYQTKNLAAGWVSNTCFEPHVCDSIFKAWAAKEKNLQIMYGWYFDQVMKKGNKVIGGSFTNNRGERLEVMAKITIDATDLGDVFAGAGAAYDFGTEDSIQSGESTAPGKTTIIQDMTWAAVLQDFGKGADKTIPMPAGYDPTRYYCSTSDAPCNDKPYALNTQRVIDYGKLRVPKGQTAKYMLNWPAHGNDTYLDVIQLKPIDREKEYAKAKNQTLGFLYFLQTVLQQKHIGLADDEMNHGMAFIPYHREGRRLRGMVRLNIDHIATPYTYNIYRTGIAVGDYPVDHHHAQYPGRVPPIPFPKVPSFNIPLGSLVPEKIDGLIVCDKGISVSNIANGSTRLQPVVLLTGQAAGILAAQCVKDKLSPGKIAVNKIQDALLAGKCYIMPFSDITPSDAAWEAVQRVGAAGIIKGTGKSEGWANKTFFYPDSLVTNKELAANMVPVHTSLASPFAGSQEKYVTLDNLLKWTKHFGGGKPGVWQKIQNGLPLLHLPSATNLPLTRKQVAVFVNYIITTLEPRLAFTDLAGKYRFTYLLQ